MSRTELSVRPVSLTQPNKNPKQSRPNPTRPNPWVDPTQEQQTLVLYSLGSRRRLGHDAANTTQQRR